MPFQNKKQKNKKCNSLHTLHNLSSPNDKENKSTGRVSSFISQKASLTVETSLVLPLFIFAICFLMFFTNIVRVQAEVANELYKQSKDLALCAYVYDSAERNGLIASGQIEDLAAGMLSNLYVKSKVNHELGDNYFESNHIENGLNLLFSTYMDEDHMIDVVAIYKIKNPCNFFHLSNIRIIQRARIHAWTGYQVEGENDLEEEIVYITLHGTVYHKDISCSHINLSVTQVSESNVKDLRNSSGGKYYECELCQDEESNGNLYITETGDRYHKIRGCSGIKREVISIPISQVGGRGPCSRCGN